MRARSTLVLAATVALLGIASCTFASIGGEETVTCGVDEAQRIFTDAGFVTDGVELVDGCRKVFKDSLHGYEMAEAVARISQDEVESLLRGAGIDPSTGSPRGDAAMGADLVEFSVHFAQPDESWQEGDMLSTNGLVTVDGSDWLRWVSWGEDRDGSGYLVKVVLDG